MTHPEEAAGRGRPPAIPGYHIEGVLGKGASGVVYRAVQLSIGRVVALKVLHPDSVRNVRVVRRLQREARTAARLTHPNIISAIDMGRADDTWWFAMELVEGKSLAEQLEHGGRLSERKALSIFIPLCDALQHASERGVVHRDVKPANILLEHDDRPRLVDLGLARVEDDPMLTRTGATLGTPHYISPEQARDPATVDVRGDIWSLGATLFHAVCGRPPFSGESAAELLSDVLYGGIPDPRALRPEMSKGLALVLRKCLSRDPDKRYFTPAELREDLERVRNHKAPAIKKSALEPLGTRLSRGRRRSVAMGVTGAAALALALLLWSPLNPWDSRDPADSGAEEAAESWPRFDALAAQLAAGEVLPAEAWFEAEELCPHAPPSYVVRCRELRDELYKRLEVELYELQKAIDGELAGLLRVHAFPEADRMLASGAAARVFDRTGFRTGDLPGRLASTFQNVLDNQRDLLARKREAALEALAESMRGYLDRVLEQKVDALREEKRFAEAIELLERDRAELFREAGADARGLDPEAVRERLKEVLTRIASSAQRLRIEQRALDDELQRWIDRRAAEYEGDLRASRIRTAADEYAAEFGRELARNKLTLERLSDPEWNALARFEARRGELLELERELLAAGAELRFEELEREIAELWPAREYEQIAVFWRDRLEDPVLQPLERMVELRLEEAEELADFLRTAAAGVQAKDGQFVELPVTSFDYKGRIEADHDPLRNGFQLVLERGGIPRTYRLRGGPSGVVLSQPRALELLASWGAAEPDGPRLVLQRALFRFHEGQLEGARELLASGELSDDDYLVYDLRRRLEEGLDRKASLRAQAHDYARALYDRLTSRKVEGDRGKAVRSIDELLQDHAEFFSPTEIAELRALKRELGSGAAASTEEEFRAVFEPEAVEFSGVDAVALRYVFDERRVGTWEKGDWHCDGVGWTRGGLVPSDAELVRSACPTLLLTDPFLVGGAQLEVELVFEQPPDSPPNLLVVSAFGFHAVFVAGAPGGRARCLVDTRDMAQVIERARAGDGEPFPGFAPGSRHRILLRVTPDAGRSAVAVDGERVFDLQLVKPAGNKRSQSVSVRSVEPVRLLSAVVRGARR